jgi:sugar lactone lactonase YvrE
VPKAQESTTYQLSGRVIKVFGGISNPNGVILSPDEKTLYANNKDREHFRTSRSRAEAHGDRMDTR